MIEEKLSECQNYHYSQSSNVSTIARNIVYAIIGTCWVLIYANGEYHDPCLWIIGALILCFIHLMLDLVHYFGDACSYRQEYFKLNQDIDIDRHEEYMNRVSKRSFRFLKAKFICVSIILIIFVIGVICQLKVFK